MKRACQALLGVAFAAGVAYWLAPLFACAPSFPEPVYARSNRPDVALPNFLSGNLGILQSSYSPSYLCAAYRLLAGTGFDEQERKAVLAFWEARQGRPDAGPEEGPSNGVKAWLAARRAVSGSGAQPEIHPFRYDRKQNFYYLNCPEDAFQTAAATLGERIQKFGAGSQQVRTWLQAQDAVFANCDGPETIPAGAAPDAELLIHADRSYQAAAAHFYAAHFDEAANRFRTIAADPTSPWKTLAPYLVARCLLRKATLAPGDQLDRPALEAAEAQLQQLLRNPQLAQMHPAARRLLRMVRYRLRPQESLQELSQAVLRKGSGETLLQDVRDYRLLLDRHMSDGTNDLTEWIRTLSSSRPGEVAVTKWETTKSLPWLVAALAKLDGRDAKSPVILAAAARIERTSPAYPTVTYHALRLLIESGQHDQARARLDNILGPERKSYSAAQLNLFVAQRRRVARNLEEFLRYAPRIPVAFSYWDGQELPASAPYYGRALLDPDAARALNQQFPLALMEESARREILPMHLRRELALAAWTKAVLIEDGPASRALASLVAALNPDLKPDLASFLDAKTEPARKFAAAFLMLNHAGARPYIAAGIGRPEYDKPEGQTPLQEIHPFRDNWWCLTSVRDYYQQPPRFAVGAFWSEKTTRPETEAGLGFLTEVERKTAAQEWERLTNVGPAPNYLGSQAIEWAKANPADPRSPQALHLVVRATRYGCVDKETTNWSRAAFLLLHQRYPKSEWTAKTKYWF